MMTDTEFVSSPVSVVGYYVNICWENRGIADEFHLVFVLVVIRKINQD